MAVDILRIEGARRWSSWVCLMPFDFAQDRRAVKESKDRVNAAILNSRLHEEAMPRHAGFEMPKDHLTINLAPADIKKEGPVFDLLIALGVLATMGDIRVWYHAQ